MQRRSRSPPIQGWSSCIPSFGVLRAGPLGMHEALRRLLPEGATSWDGEWWALTHDRLETGEFMPGILHVEPVRGMERVPVWRPAPEWRRLPIRRAPRPGPLVGPEGVADAAAAEPEATAGGDAEGELVADLGGAVDKLVVAPGQRVGWGGESGALS